MVTVVQAGWLDGWMDGGTKGQWNWGRGWSISVMGAAEGSGGFSLENRS